MDILGLAIKNNNYIFYKLYNLGDKLYENLIVETKNRKVNIKFDYLEESFGEVYIHFKEIGKKNNTALNIKDVIDIYLFKEENKMSRKEKLLNELEQIKKEFNEKIENIQKQIEDDSKWIPKYKDEYFYIDSTGIIDKDTNEHYMKDIERIKSLNYYQTKEQAKRIAFEELLHRKLKKFANENNDDLNLDNLYEYFIYYSKNTIQVGSTFKSTSNFGHVYFTSRKIAEKAIEEFKDDLIRYFTTDK